MTVGIMANIREWMGKSFKRWNVWNFWTRIIIWVLIIICQNLERVVVGTSMEPIAAKPRLTVCWL
jgi:hypothetical protein